MYFISNQLLLTVHMPRHIPRQKKVQSVSFILFCKYFIRTYTQTRDDNTKFIFDALPWHLVQPLHLVVLDLVEDLWFQESEVVGGFHQVEGDLRTKHWKYLSLLAFIARNSRFLLRLVSLKQVLQCKLF